MYWIVWAFIVLIALMVLGFFLHVLLWAAGGILLVVGLAWAWQMRRRHPILAGAILLVIVLGLVQYVAQLWSTLWPALLALLAVAVVWDLTAASKRPRS